MRINKREAEYVKTAVLYGRSIEISGWSSKPLWDNDVLLPVKVGKVVEGLITKGLFKKVEWSPGYTRIYKTPLANTFECKNPGCHHGNLYDERDLPSGNCPVCEGRGIVLDNGG